MNGTVLRNARVVSDGRTREGDLWVVGERIAGVGRVRPPAGVPERDLSGAMLLPGLIDLQVNGLGGAEVYHADAAALQTIVQTAPRLGCTALLLTQISTGPGACSQLASALERLPVGGARLLGIHVEGPFLNPSLPGAHPPAALRLPSTKETADTLAALQGKVRLWTLAPELASAGDVIQLLNQAGVVVGAGHSALSYEQALWWFRNGVSLVTHLFNAMTGLHHRRPGLAAAALLDDKVRFSIIADGQHSSPAMVQLAHRLGGGRLILVSDAAAPAGAPEGAYTVAGQPVVSSKGAVRLPDGTLAGSTLGAFEAVRHLAQYAALSTPEASAAMTSRPADLLGLDDLGRLDEGARADFLVLDDQQGLAETWVRGRPEFVRRQGSRP